MQEQEKDKGAELERKPEPPLRNPTESNDTEEPETLEVEPLSAGAESDIGDGDQAKFLVLEQTHIGPIPTPRDLQQYAEISADLVPKIVGMAEEE